MKKEVDEQEVEEGVMVAISGRELVRIGGLVELSMLVVGGFLVWLLAVPVMVGDVWWGIVGGIVGGVVMFGGVWVSLWAEWGWAQALRRDLDRVLPLFAQANWWQLGLISLCAGVGEEMLFRGFLQGWIGEWGGVWLGIVVSSVLFGLAHAISVWYVIYTMVMGVVLGVAYQTTGNLVGVMVAHFVYDWVALLYGTRWWYEGDVSDRDPYGGDD